MYGMLAPIASKTDARLKCLLKQFDRVITFSYNKLRGEVTFFY